MRMPFRSTLLLASFVFANSAFGNADPIIVIVTTVGTGTFNSQPFTNRLSHSLPRSRQRPLMLAKAFSQMGDADEIAPHFPSPTSMNRLLSR